MNTTDTYWTGPHKYDAEAFDRRYDWDNLAFWTPLFVRLADIDRHHKVLDVGCATGSFTISLSKATGAALTGCDVSPALLEKARCKCDAMGIEWVEGNAECLPFPDATFDRLLLSLVLHQIEDREGALREARRVLKPSGRVTIRTVSPEDAAKRVPFRLFPKVAEVELQRMPGIAALRELLATVGFGDVTTETVCRNKLLDIAEVAESLRRRERPSYQLLNDEEIEDGIAALVREADKGTLVDERPVFFLTARREPLAGEGAHDKRIHAAPYS